jgi:hypothetical protein
MISIIPILFALNSTATSIIKPQYAIYLLMDDIQFNMLIYNILDNARANA